jgi:hypothetical protein
VGVDRESEAALAATLADVLGDGRFWREYAAAPTAPAPSPLLAQRAVDLWRSIVTFLGEIPDVDVDLDEPIVEAVAVAREMADWGVLASYAREQVGERIPPRSAFEWLIHVGGVDSWAQGLGHDLPIMENAEFPDEAWPKEERDDESGPEASDLVESWAVISKRYGWFLEQLEDEGDYGRRVWESAEMKETVEQWRELMAQLIDLTRPWLTWCRRSGEIELLPLAGAMLFMVEGLFAAGWRWPEDGVMLPPPAMISQVLRESESLEWLTEHGAELPEWLT